MKRWIFKRAGMPRQEQGFTLLELMVVIVSVIILVSLILLFR